MADEETVVVSDISDGSSDSTNDGGGFLPLPVRGGLPPFVIKLYDIVSDKSSDSIISWAPNLAQTQNQVVRGGATSFVIWNDTDFVNNVLPLISRSNNLDSFITQLNNYGFKKISWYRREYANPWFQEEKRHLLINIKRRSKQDASGTRKLTIEIKKLERESKEFDLERTTFIQHVDNTMTNQKRIVQAMAKAIKSTFDHHHNVRMCNEAENRNRFTTETLAWVCQQDHEANIYGESSSGGDRKLN